MSEADSTARTSNPQLPRNIKDRTGHVYGRWTVIAFTGTKSKRAQWLLRCECGTERVVASQSLVGGRSRSCGCLNAEMVSARCRTHGLSGTPVFNVWSSMNQRCVNANDKFYHEYGARGISVCERWRESFENFYADMGPRPSDKHSIDRRDNDGNYEPSNCRWATRTEQARNRSNNVIISYKGKSQCIAAWAEEVGMKSRTLRDRLKSGWSAEDALTKPVKE